MNPKFKVGATVKSIESKGKNAKCYRITAILTRQTGNKTLIRYELNPIASGKLVMDERALVLA